MNPARSDSVRLIEVIEVQTCKGKGTEDDLMRIITEYWSKDGILLAVYDPEKSGFKRRTSPQRYE